MNNIWELLSLTIAVWGGIILCEFLIDRVVRLVQNIRQRKLEKVLNRILNG